MRKILLLFYFIYNQDNQASDPTLPHSYPSGSALLTSFTFSCSGWRDEGQSNPVLSYKFFIDAATSTSNSSTSSSSSRELIYYGSSPKSPGLLLRAGNASDLNNLRVYAEVYDEFGSFNQTILYIQVIVYTNRCELNR